MRGRRSRCSQFAAALAYALALLGGIPAQANTPAKVFPVKGFFYDASSGSPLDAAFRQLVERMGPGALGAQVHEALGQALQGRIGPLDKPRAGHPFAASFHVTRATSYTVDKGNGNSDLLTPITPSLYFTNVRSGEILMTISRTVVGRVVIANSNSLDGEKDRLFAQTLSTLVRELVDEAGRNFQPQQVLVRVTDLAGNLLVLDGGYRRGVQAGDMLDGPAGQLIEVIYAAENYAVAQRILADTAGPGATFHKFISHPADGKVRPRTAVLVESLPKGFSAEYLAQLFAEQVGDKAPLSVVQVNPGFSQLLRTVAEQASLSMDDTKRRKTPDYFIRLRVAEPVILELPTNLEFQTLRRYEAIAFADIVDTSGRVIFSAAGRDRITDAITRGIGAGIGERREVVIKNALVDLASRLAQLSEPRREQVPLLSALSPFQVASAGTVFWPQQKGTVLRPLRITTGSGVKQAWVPRMDAHVESSDGERAVLAPLLPFDRAHESAAPGDLFEVQRLGATPRSATPFTLCESTEHLGRLRTPLLRELTGHALGSAMPGLLYAPDIESAAQAAIGPQSGFASAVSWKRPTTELCVQPVDRVDATEGQCAAQCDRPITARYTLRVKSGQNVLGRNGIERQFKSTSFYPNTPAVQTERLLESDLIDEGSQLLQQAAPKVNLSPARREP